MSIESVMPSKHLIFCCPLLPLVTVNHIISASHGPVISNLFHKIVLTNGLPWWLSWVKNLPAMLETWVLSLGQEDPLEKRTATHCSILAWRIPWTEKESFAFIKDLFI